MTSYRLCCWIAFVVCTVIAAVTEAEPSYEIDWVKQYGTEGYDHTDAVTVDAWDNIYVTGRTGGSLGGPSAGQDDIYISKFKPDGTLVWIKQYGDQFGNLGRDITTDTAGDIIVVGDAYGPLTGSGDGFISKFTPDGSLIWTDQFAGVPDGELTHSVVTDEAGNIYVSGTTTGSLGGPNAGSFDAFVRKYSPDGAHVWTKQFGTTDSDTCYGLAVNAIGNLFVTGYTHGTLGQASAGYRDAYVRKYNSDGTEAWTEQLGTTASDGAWRLTLDPAGDVLITGSTNGDLATTNVGLVDVFVAKYSTDGTQIWIRQFGSPSSESSYGITTDILGNVFIAGGTGGTLGDIGSGSYDIIVSKFTSDGTFAWTKQIGTSASDFSYDVATDSTGNVYVTGHTYGDLAGPNAGLNDVVLIKLVVPEPATTLFFILGSVSCLVFSGRRQ